MSKQRHDIGRQKREKSEIKKLERERRRRRKLQERATRRALGINQNIALISLSLRKGAHLRRRF